MRNYEKESDLRELPLAMAYVPWQHLDRIYENQGRRCVKK